jgi:hypothetical protein
MDVDAALDTLRWIGLSICIRKERHIKGSLSGLKRVSPIQLFSPSAAQPIWDLNQ